MFCLNKFVVFLVFIFPVGWVICVVSAQHLNWSKIFFCCFDLQQYFLEKEASSVESVAEKIVKAIPELAKESNEVTPVVEENSVNQEAGEDTPEIKVSLT